MKVSLLMIHTMATEDTYTEMATTTLECGKTERDKGMVNWSTKMVKYMKESGKTVNLQAIENDKYN